jgi:hypothetical protein
MAGIMMYDTAALMLAASCFLHRATLCCNAQLMSLNYSNSGASGYKLDTTLTTGKTKGSACQHELRQRCIDAQASLQAPTASLHT